MDTSSQPRRQLKLSYPVRILLVTITMLVCLTLFVMLLARQSNGGILMFPIALSAWILGKRALYVCLISIVLTIILFETTKTGLAIVGNHWSIYYMLGFIFGILALWLQGSMIIWLRQSLKFAVYGQQQAQQAELQMMEAYKQQRELNLLKDEFILHINHEFRTPLTEIIGYLDLLQEYGKVEKLDPAVYANFIERAREGSLSIERLVEHISQSAEIDTQKLVMQPLYLASCIEKTLTELSMTYPRASEIRREIAPDIRIVADVQALQQILRHLLTNALIYTKPETAITISATSSSGAQRNHTCISVQDAGPGIPAAEATLIFDRFVRLKRDLSSSIRGAGLGLYISKQLVEQMHGQIWVENRHDTNQPAHGSCFNFTLDSAMDA